MKRFCLAIIFFCILSGFQAVADEEGLQTQTQGDVTFVSGGIGGDERDAMQVMLADYNLKLLFSVSGTGEYLSDVNVRITDSSGDIFLETLSEGPMFFAKLKPGRYTVTVDMNGHSIHKKAIIAGKRRTSLSFIWSKEQVD